MAYSKGQCAEIEQHCLISLWHQHDSHMNLTEAYIKRTDLTDGITDLEFFHPKSNSLPGIMLEQLADEIRKCSDDERVQVVILRSGGDGVFCAGASFHELMAIQDVKAGLKFFSGFARVINACRKCLKPIVGQVQGKAIGGGVGLAAAVDYCLATPDASIRLSELGIGIGPFVIEPVVTRKIGLAAFSRLALDYEKPQSAEWALTHGLYQEILPDITELAARAQELARSLAHTNPAARVHLKQVLWAGCDHWDELLEKRAALSGKLVLSEFTREALARFRS